MFGADLRNYTSWPPQPVHIRFPNNVCVPTEEHYLELSQLFREHAPKVFEMQQNDWDHDGNMYELKGLSGTSQEQELVKEIEKKDLLHDIYESHNALKYVEADEGLDDIQEEVRKYEVETAYLQSTKKAHSEKEKQTAEQTYCDYYFPQPSTSRFKVSQSRQKFLNSLENYLNYWETKGFKPVWKVDSTPVRTVLSNVVQSANAARDAKTENIAVKFYEHLDIEEKEYKNQFSQRFLQFIILQVRNFINSKSLGLKLTEMQFVALGCLKNLVQLRVALEQRKPITAIALEFGYYFGKIKRLDFEFIIEGFETPPQQSRAKP